MLVRRLIARRGDYESLRSRFEEVGTDASGWETYYRDPETGEKWCDAFLLWDYPCLVRLPLPSSDELISIALGTTFTDEAVAAAVMLAKESEAAEEIMHRLEEKSQEADLRNWERIGLIIEWASLESRMNRRETRGKNYAEVKADHEHFLRIADRAHRLKAKAEQMTGHKFEKNYEVFV